MKRQILHSTIGTHLIGTVAVHIKEIFFCKWKSKKYTIKTYNFSYPTKSLTVSIIMERSLTCTLWVLSHWNFCSIMNGSDPLFEWKPILPPVSIHHQEPVWVCPAQRYKDLFCHTKWHSFLIIFCIYFPSIAKKFNNIWPFIIVVAMKLCLIYEFSTILLCDC
jgi:hypothetical protein